jgi:hypothetical protein
VDAIVSVGHALSHLPNEAALERAMTAIAMALRIGGVLALDLCDLAWGRIRRDTPMAAWVVVTSRANSAISNSSGP